ncbi:unnamed protein product [Rotaria sp. Silwood2]|nr:unnamed protein product [Rotaria sp. Silwood2]
MILRQFYFAGDRNDPLESKKVTNFISSIIEKFQYSQSSKLQYLNLLNSLRTSMARLRFSVTSMLIEGTSNSYERVTINLPNSLRKNYKCLDYILSIDTQFYFGQKSCSLIDYFTRLFWILEHSNKFSTRYRMSVALNEIPKYLLFRNDEDLLFSLTFIPTHLRNLYLQLLKKEFIMIHSKDCTVNKKEHFFFGHILLECLILLSNTSCKRRSLMGALITLLPMLRMHHLENFGSTLLWTLATKDSWYLSNFEIIRQHPMNYTTGMYINKNKNFYPGYDMRDEERRILIKKCIEQKQQRLQNALADCNKKCMELYSACISLARTCRWTQDNNRLTLLEQSVHGALSIDNKLVRLDALCIIGLYSDSDHNQIKTKNGISLQKEIELQLHDIYSDISLLLHTAIFIRCLPLLEDQQAMNKCLQNLLDKLINAQQRDQQVVYEALFPYFESNFTFSSILKQISNSFVNYNKTVNNKSSVIMEYINDNSNENLSSTVLVSNLYLAELTSDVQKLIAIDDLSMIISHSNLPIIDNSIASRLFQFEGPILTFIQVFTITNIIVSNYSIESEKLYAILNNALHYFDFVEFKACRLLESWMKWKNSNKLSPFAWHAALILVNSDLWSVEAAIIVCDLLCNENDRFRQRAEIIFRSESDDHIRTSSNLGIDVLLALVTRKAHYQHISPSVNLTLYRMFENLTVDIESHLVTLLWFERYRIHALVNKEVFLINRRFSSISPISSHFRNDFRIDVTFCDGINRMSNDLVHYMCNLITSNFLLFLDIDGDTTSNGVLKSHTQFIISVFTYLISLIQYNNEVRSLMIDTLMTLFETSENNEIRRVAVHALSYVCDKNTYKFVFAKLQTAVAENNASKTLDQSDDSLSSVISSYCHCVSINNIVFDQDDMNVFRKLLKYSSPNVLRAVHVGRGRVLQNTSLLFEMLDLDYIQCYHALMESTAYLFLYNVRRSSADTAAAFVEEHFNLLPIIVVNLYNSVRHFTNEILHVRTVDYYLAHGYPRYVEIAGLIAMQMPAAFCAYVNDWQDGDNLKRALFYTSKQHNFSQRAACLTILSIFGELTIELCEMFIEALRDDPHIQNTCYKCLTRINFIKDEEAVLNKLFFYLKSKSMNVRYITAKIFLHLSKSSLISSRQVQIVLNDLILDPSSNESLWLIRDQDLVQAECVYNYVGPLKDVVYSLLIRHLAGDATETIQRNELNYIDASFAESETAARFSSCLYEAKTEENLLSKSPSKKVNLDN